MPSESPLADPVSESARREVALSLMDDSVYGYLAITVNRIDDDHFNIGFASDVDPAYWAAVSETLTRVLMVIR